MAELQTEVEMGLLTAVLKPMVLAQRCFHTFVFSFSDLRAVDDGAFRVPPPFPPVSEGVHWTLPGWSCLLSPVLLASSFCFWPPSLREKKVGATLTCANSQTNCSFFFVLMNQ